MDNKDRNVVYDSSAIPHFITTTKVCKDCEQEFILTPGEQYFYHTKKWNQPKRCPKCRETRKIAISEEGGNDND